MLARLAVIASLSLLGASVSVQLPRSAQAVVNTQNIAYVYDDTIFACSPSCGLNDTRGPGSGASIFVNALTGIAPGTGNTGAYTPVTGSAVNLANLPLSTLNTNPTALSGFDTAIIYQTCGIGSPSNSSALAAINNFVNSGGKLMIFDADGCASIAIGPADWSNFVFPFSTNSPGPLGASGSYTSVENSPLTAGLSAGPQTGDAVGDANIFTTFNGSWFQAIAATNANNVTGIVEAYARSASGGLAIYEGEDFWFTDGASSHLRTVFDDMLNQPWNPDHLPGTTAASGITLTPVSQSCHVPCTATFTATVTDAGGNPKGGISVTFHVTTGPDTGTTFNQLTTANGQVPFVLNGAHSGKDVVSATFADSAGAIHTSNSVTASFIVVCHSVSADHSLSNNIVVGSVSGGGCTNVTLTLTNATFLWGQVTITTSGGASVIPSGGNLISALGLIPPADIFGSSPTSLAWFGTFNRPGEFAQFFLDTSSGEARFADGVFVVLDAVVGPLSDAILESSTLINDLPQLAHLRRATDIMSACENANEGKIAAGARSIACAIRGGALGQIKASLTDATEAAVWQDIASSLGKLVTKTALAEVSHRATFVVTSLIQSEVTLLSRLFQAPAGSVLFQAQ